MCVVLTLILGSLYYTQTKKAREMEWFLFIAADRPLLLCVRVHVFVYRPVWSASRQWSNVHR